MNHTRREWLSACLTLPVLQQVLAAREHARKAVDSGSYRFQVFDESTAGDVQALTAQIIPSTNGPGATEAGVIYFIDRALTTFASDHQDDFRSGLTAVERKRQERFPASTSIANLTTEQQIELIRAIETTAFFDLLRAMTVLGFLADPSYGGNRDGIGWKQIGFDPQMAYERPFGYYDAAEGGEK